MSNKKNPSIDQFIDFLVKGLFFHNIRERDKSHLVHIYLLIASLTKEFDFLSARKDRLQIYMNLVKGRHDSLKRSYLVMKFVCVGTKIKGLHLLRVGPEKGCNNNPL